MRRYRDQETTLDQQYLADLVEAVERLTNVIAERIPRVLDEPVHAYIDSRHDHLCRCPGCKPQPPDEDLEPDIDDEPPSDYGPPGSGAVITEYD